MQLIIRDLIYRSPLESTLFYKDWATAHRRFLWNDPAVETDSILGSKRKCLFPDNRFSGIKGLDDDLKQIVLKNPMHKTTIQYLGSLYLLSKDIPRFKATLETFYGTPALPSVLPVCFQEGVVVFAAGDRETNSILCRMFFSLNRQRYAKSIFSYSLRP